MILSDKWQLLRQRGSICRSNTETIAESLLHPLEPLDCTEDVRFLTEGVSLPEREWVLHAKRFLLNQQQWPARCA